MKPPALPTWLRPHGTAAPWRTAASRTLAAVLGGYALALGFTATVSLALSALCGMARSEAVVSAAMLSFVIYLLALLRAFTTRSATRAGLRSAHSAPGFRAAMDDVHTWAGVLFGALLFAIFFMGTLSVFDREIDRWAQPRTRMAAPADHAARLDAALAHLGVLAPARAANWLVYPPSERAPTLRLGWSGGGAEPGWRDLDPATGELLAEQGAPLGTRLFFPFHYSLHLKWLDLGRWLVGAAAMAMLLAVVSGVATHRRIFKDFFTFRPRKQLQRASLDLHSVTAVFALPFHFVIALSGLIVFFSMYLQPAIEMVYGGKREAFNNELLSRYTRAPARRALVQRASLDTMAERARAQWAAVGTPGEVELIVIRNPRDAHAVAEVRRAYRERVTLSADTQYFDAGSGELLHSEALKPAARTQRFIIGLHLIQFEHWTLRWLYFALGLAGCVMIATGSIVWAAKRRERHARQGRSGAAIVEALNVAAVTGLAIATAATLLANMLLPVLWPELADAPLALAMRVFFGVWLAGLLHALALHRRRTHWRQQTGLLAVLALAAVVLNWVVTGDHLLRTLSQGLWATAGVDLGLLAAAATAGLAWHRLRRAARQAPQPRPMDAAMQGVEAR